MLKDKDNQFNSLLINTFEPGVEGKFKDKNRLKYHYMFTVK